IPGCTCRYLSQKGPSLLSSDITRNVTAPPAESRRQASSQVEARRTFDTLAFSPLGACRPLLQTIPLPTDLRHLKGPPHDPTHTPPPPTAPPPPPPAPAATSPGPAPPPWPPPCPTAESRAPWSASAWASSAWATAATRCSTPSCPTRTAPSSPCATCGSPTSTS